MAEGPGQVGLAEAPADVSPAALSKDAPSRDESIPPIPYHKLFSFAERSDYIIMVAGFVAAMGNGAAWPTFAILFGDFSDVFGEGSNSKFMEDVTQIALSFLYLSIGALICSYLQASLWMLAGNRLTNRLRERYLAAVLRQEIGYFDTQATTGKLLAGLNDDSTAVQQATGEKVATFVQHASTFIIGWTVAFVYGWDMTLVMVGCLPFLAAVGAILSKVTVVLTERAQASYTRASSVAQQNISQIRTVVSYGGEEKALEQYAKELEGPVMFGRRQSLYSGIALGGINAVVYFTYAVAFFYGAWRVSTGAYTGGQVMQVLVAALLGGFSLGQASPLISTFNRGRAAGAHMLAVINRKPAIDVDDPAGESPPEATVRGELSFVDVSFAYPARPDTTVLTGFNLSISAGKTVALVGSSGSGKSTVVGLIERFYDPASGTVLLDGRDLRSYNLKWLRNQVGLVSQEPTLFATTIYENILMGRPGASVEEVEAAARAANAHNFVSAMPQAYDTQVGERGVQLSGGQKQRIAIARAILKNPKVLCLDEATSALDAASERLVQDALDRMVVGRTTVVVAHRLSTVRNADCIAVVSRGVVVESGTHDELTANPLGAYSVLVKLQMAEGAAEADEDEDQISSGTEADEAAAPRVLLAPADLDAPKSGPLSAGSVPHPHVPTTRGSQEGAGILSALRGRLSRDSRPHAGVEIALQNAPGSGAAGTGTAPGSGVGGGRRSSVEVRIPMAPDSQEDVKKGVVDEKEGKEVAVVEKPVDVPLSRLIAYNKPEWLYAVIGTAASMANGVVQPAFAFIISSMIAVFYLSDAKKIRSESSFWSWMFFLIGCGNWIATCIQQYCFGVMGHELARRMRTQLLRSILHQEVGWFDLDQNSSGVLTSRLASDATHVRGAVGDTLSLILQNVTCLAFGYLIAFAFMWRMALVVTGALPFMIFGAAIYYKTVTGHETGAAQLYGGANQAVSDAFSSIRVVQAYNLQDRVGSLYSSKLKETNVTLVKRSHLTGALMGYSQFSTFAIYSLIIWFGGLEVDKGRASFEDMLKAFLAILLAAMGIAQAQVGFPDMGKAKAAIASIFPLIDRKSAIDASKPDGLAPPDAEVRGEIELREVKFVYPARPSVVVFRHFSLSIPAGKAVALVGESGSGKSTIVGLLERFYDPLEGMVMLDGRDLRDYNLKWLRKQIGLVSQEPLLFSCSVLDNIRYARPEASMEEVVAAARVANAHDLIEAFPDKYETQVGERGVQLSGGQKQRIAIARAVIKNPKIMLLDEATSALDAASERLVQEALDRIMAGRTSVVVAHRLSTIRNANKIALVHRGVVLETGTHEELMARDGGYARLVEAQMGSKSNGRSMARSASVAKAVGQAAAAAPAVLDEE